jgi:hypothetical protein
MTCALRGHKGNYPICAASHAEPAQYSGDPVQHGKNPGDRLLYRCFGAAPITTISIHNGCLGEFITPLHSFHNFATIEKIIWRGQCSDTQKRRPVGDTGEIHTT